MFELIYPEDPAPLMSVKSVRGNTEVLPIVEPSGLVIGRSSRKACHGNLSLLHPVVHLHIIDHFGRIYLQKRSESKDLFPGYWDTAVGGHVSYGESLSEALFREAAEELGLVDFNPIYLQSYVFTNQHENELVNIFAVVTDRTITPDSDEVAEGDWWTCERIESEMGRDKLTPQFESEYLKIKETLLALL